MSSTDLAESASPVLDAAPMLAPSIVDLSLLDASLVEASPGEISRSDATEIEASPEPDSPVNYDDEGLTEVTLGETQFRFDSGKQGTALCLSRRTAGTYRWSYVGELRWDGRDLRSRALERKLLGELSLALRRFMEESAS
jgi:hypothetical protein